LDSTLYKFRRIDDRSIACVQRPELYFAGPHQFNDPHELKVQLEIAPDKHRIVEHLRDYLNVLLSELSNERKLLADVATIARDGDIVAWERASRRAARIEVFSQRIEDARKRIERAEAGDPISAKRDLEQFYAQIVEQLSHAAFCCLSRSMNDTLWITYADEHRGLCFEFADDPPVFRHDKKIIRRDVFYSGNGSIDPLEHGYLRTFELIYCTKAESLSWENEARFFIYGDPRAVRVPGANLSAVIFGCRALTGEGLSKDNKENHLKRVTNLVRAIIEANRTRRGAAKIRIKTVTAQTLALRVSEVEDINGFLRMTGVR
jgi:hypothetical protein